MASELRTAEGTAAGDTAPPAGAGLLAVLRSLGPGRIAALGLVVLGLAAFFTYVIGRTLEAPYTLLYAELAPGDAGELIGKLEAQGVPYRLGPGGDALMVPADQALRLRMELAQDGLPGGGLVGYEIFDRADPLGSSDLLTDVRLKRALEGELARTIATLRMVRAARVHLVQPARSLFERERREPTASVVLALRRAGSVEQRQIQGIRQLVAAAVPGLDAARVTILDDRGNLLARGSDAGSPAFAATEAQELRIGQESRLKQKIVQLLERTIGPGRVDAEVTVEMDFDEISTTAETFDPDGQVVRSSSTVEEQGERREAGQEGAVSVAGNLPTGEAAPEDAGGERERSNRTEETVNFEISRTLRNQTRRGGTVRRISIAVQVDGIYREEQDGSRSYAAREPAELEQIATLVRSAAGLDEERGDVVEVISRRFVQPVIEEPLPSSSFSLTREEIWRLGELLALVISSLAVMLLGVRPLLRHLLPAPPPSPAPAGAAPGGRLEPADPAALPGAGEAEGATALPPGSPAGALEGPSEQPLLRLSGVEGRVKSSLVREVTELIGRHPDETTRVVRNWLHGN
ncbi:flagellar basal-body MS-ring/collar protein FliF [Geminicoccaceae bacterium 1502E]|nr:flagellar basal-body MS-ring/collar protein FliF [Geminicoccaceae bacterium 1502E]